MTEGPGLLSRIGRIFGFQALFITLAVILSVFIVRIVLEEVLVRRALELEATFFAERLAKNAAAPLPVTRNLLGYLDGGEPPPPDVLANLAEGLHFQVLINEVDPALTHPVHVSRLPDGRRLYLVFRAANVDRLVRYFGVIPLAAALLLIYLSSWLVFRLSRRAISPVIFLARRVALLDPTAPGTPLSDDFQQGEAATLARALDRFTERIRTLVDRERQFTADASHELRTPVTVIKGAGEMLAAEPQLSEKGRNRVAMIQRNAQSMSELIDTLLTLAREEEAAAGAPTLVNEVVTDCVENCAPLLAEKPVRISIEAPYQLQVRAPGQPLTIVIGNLIRNACRYTESGDINIRVTGDRVEVQDTGPGIPEEDLERAQQRGWRRSSDHDNDAGTGIGLALAQRFCERYGWQLKLENRQDRTGLRATVTFFF